MNFHEQKEIKILEEILKTSEASLEVNRRALFELLEIKQLLTPQPITGFTFQQENPMLPFNPGQAGIVITITPVPAGVVLTQAAPTTVSSDPVNFPVSVDATGLIATFGALGTTIGATATLTTSYTNADGNVATSTSQPFGPIVAAVTDVTGFTFAQTT